jgi:hypothetical protein
MPLSFCYCGTCTQEYSADDGPMVTPGLRSNRERNRRYWPVSLACEVLGVSPSGYHERKARENVDTSRSRRSIGNDVLLMHIRAVHAKTKGEYGWPRV